MIPVLLALWRMVSFTAPDSGSSHTARYLFNRSSDRDGEVVCRVYNSPSSADSVIMPKPPGDLEQFYLVLTQTENNAYGALRGGQRITVRAIGAGGAIAERSNVLAMAAGCRDTLYSCGLGSWAYPVNGVVAWSLPAADSALSPYGPGPVIRYEDAVADTLGRWLCQSYSGFALAGGWRLCPVSDLRATSPR